MVRIVVVLFITVSKFTSVPPCLIVTKLVTDGRSSILLLSEMFCHSHGLHDTATLLPTGHT